MKPYFLAGTLLVALAGDAVAQDKLPPIRQLGPVLATTTDTFRTIGHIRALSNGRLLLNDPFGRRVVLLDSALRVVTVAADSTPTTANAYGQRPGGLIAYKGDSTLFIDPASLSMLVIDPDGKIGRVMSIPRAQEANALTSMSMGLPGFDSDGRLVYRANPDFRRIMQSVAGGSGGAAPAPPEMPDTAAIVRLDLATRKLDTIAWYKIPRVQNSMSRDADGKMTFTQVINPLPQADEWVVTADGRVAIVRNSDYHVDWVGADGKLVATPKIPFEWQRLTDEDKVALIDSVKAIRERTVAQSGSSGGAQIAFGGAPGAAPGGAAGGAPTQRIEVRTMVTAEMGARGGAPVSSGPIQTNITFVSPSELPDYKPPFLPNSVRADAEGNIWVLTVPTKQVPGGPVYDVIDGKGQLVDRVQIPAGRTIRGFGPGIVYLTTFVDGRLALEAARVR